MDHVINTDNITYSNYSALYLPDQANWVVILGIILFCLLIIITVAISQKLQTST